MAERDVILLVDDDPEVIRLLGEHLEAEGYLVLVARTGGDGLRLLRERPVTLLLLDLVLPDMGGLNLMREARGLPTPPEVVIVTGYASLETAIEAVEGSAAGYIVKPVDLGRLSIIVGRVIERRRLLRENAELQKALQGRLAESEALAAVSASVSSTLDVHEALRRTGRELARLLGADTVAAYLHDRDADRLVPTAAYHVPKQHLERLTTLVLPLREGEFYLPLWRARRPVYSDDVPNDPRFAHETFRSLPHRSALVLPLVAGAAVVGAVYAVWWTARRTFEERELALAQRVGEQAGLLVQNVRLYEEARRSKQRLEVLHEVSRHVAAAHDAEAVLTRIVDEATRLLRADGAGLRFRDGDDLVIGARTESVVGVMAVARLGIGEGLSGAVTVSGEAVTVEDLAADTRYPAAHKRRALEQGFRGFIGVPLRTQDRVIGNLNVYTRAPRRFGSDEVAVLLAFADQASVAVEKARLFRESEEGRQLLERLYQAGLAMQASWERDDRLEAFVKAVHDVLGFDRVRVLLLAPGGGHLELVRELGESGEPAAGRIPHSPASGPFWQAMEQRRAVAVLADEDLERVAPVAAELTSHPVFRTRRFVVAPLVAGERVIGVVGADNKPSRRAISPASVGPFSTLCQNLAVALEESRLYAETRAREEQATKLYHVTREIAISLDRERVLGLIVSQTAELTGCDTNGIYMYDEAKGGLMFDRGLNIDAELARTLVLKPGEGIGGRAFQERRPVWTRDRLADPSLQYAPAAKRLIDTIRSRAYLGVPIMGPDEVYGVLLVSFFEPHDFTTPEIQLVSTLADHAALALENARLFEETRTREREAKTLSEGLTLLNQASRALHRTLEVDTMLAGALEALAAAFGADGALVNLFVGDGTFVRSVGRWMKDIAAPANPVRPGGITRLVLNTRAPVLVRDTAARPDVVNPDNVARGVKSIAAFPVLGQQQRALGVLVLYYKVPQVFRETEVRLLTSYADQLATALENAQLYEQTQTQQVRLAQILESTSDGVVLVDRPGEIQAANRRAGELLSFDAADVVGVGLAELLAGYRSSITDYDRVVAPLLALLEDPDRDARGDLELRRGGRVIHWVGQPTKDAAGTTIGFTLTLRDVTQEQQVSQMKSDFVSFVTHQLRTPLAGIKWMLELAAQAPDLNEDAAANVHDARQAAERLIGLVNDLLDVSRLESGRLKVEPRPTDVGALTRSVLDDLATLVRDRGHRLSVAVGEALPTVMVDPQLLRQVILNLVSNAIKYTPAGGDVAVRIGVRDHALRWEVKDSGIGIPEASRERLFEKFYRAENVNTIETEGTGLGLYIVRLIVEKFGGEVRCESEEGKGSTFIFTLPVNG